jgi:hypothetical protein
MVISASDITITIICLMTTKKRGNYPNDIFSKPSRGIECRYATLDSLISFNCFLTGLNLPGGKFAFAHLQK